jgi:SET domain-containing protein
MYRPIRNVVRFVLFIGVLALLSVALSTSLPSNTPYVSALSTASLGSDALAAPKCNHNFCSHGTFCVRDVSRNMNCTQTGTRSCTAVSC